MKTNAHFLLIFHTDLPKITLQEKRSQDQPLTHLTWTIQRIRLKIIHRKGYLHYCSHLLGPGTYLLVIIYKFLSLLRRKSLNVQDIDFKRILQFFSKHPEYWKNQSEDLKGQENLRDYQVIH